MDAAETIRRARHQAGLTQRELADRAGTSQSALARYEGARSTPSLRTLERILRAAGKSLRIEIDDATSIPTGRPVGAQVQARMPRVRSVLDSYGVTDARVFGSTARGEDTRGSDLDLLVELPGATLIRLASLKADLEDVLDVPVDVTVTDLLSDEARERATAESVPL